MSRRFWISILLTFPLVILAFGAELGWQPIPMTASMLLQLALATPVVLWGGWPFFERLWASLKTRNLNMGLHIMSGDWTLMAHGILNLVYDHQSGPRGNDKTFASGMLMGMARRPLGNGTLQ